jgi:toxin-antitoxin system PIN domain toxin
VSALLFDTSIWIAVVFPAHPLHGTARATLSRATAAAPAVFCRSTQQSFLRLVSTPTLFRAFGTEVVTNRDALAMLGALLALAQVRERTEPPGTALLWHRLAERDTPSPKIWMDAYLAAFAMRDDLQFVTLDRDFRVFEREGLNLLLLEA